MNPKYEYQPETSNDVPTSCSPLVNGAIFNTRVSTRTEKPGKIIVHLENLELSWNFEKFTKYDKKLYEIWKNFVANKIHI